jgi:hypothetical protein
MTTFLVPDAAHYPVAPPVTLISGGELVSGTNPLPISGSFSANLTNDGTFAKETGGNLATIVTDLTPFVTAGGGGYIRQDSTATIAKESGGNLATLAGIVSASKAAVKAAAGDFADLATIVTNSNPFVASGAGGYIRQDSTATIAKESGGNLATLAGAIASNRAQVGRLTTAVYTLASGAQTANGNSGDLTVGPYTEIAIDLNITANSGTSQTLQFFWERKGADGVYYVIWQTNVITTTNQALSTSIGAGMAYNQSLGATGRLRWVITGTTPSYTFSANVQGK